MDKQKFERYATLKSEMKILEEEIKKLAPEILEMVDTTKEKRVESDFGIFSVTTRRNWKFTHAVTAIEEEVDRMKEEEIATGKAKATETKSVRFDVPKEDEQQI